LRLRRHARTLARTDDGPGSQSDQASRRQHQEKRPQAARVAFHVGSPFWAWNDPFVLAPVVSRLYWCRDGYTARGTTEPNHGRAPFFVGRKGNSLGGVSFQPIQLT